MKLTQNQYFGLKSEMPDILPEGSTFFATDEDRVYMYGEDSRGTIQDTPIPSIENDGTGEFKQEVKAGFLVTSQKKLGVWQTIQKASVDETFIRTAVKTGVGSFHLGEMHSIGSGGEDVVFVNEKSNIAWSPVWQGTSTDGLTVIKPSVRKDGAVQDIYPLGLTHTTGTIRDYITGLSVAQNLKVFSATFVPAENYSGKLSWRATFDSDLGELSSFSQDVVLTAGTPYKFQFKYPLSLRTTSGTSTSRIIKANETPLKVYAATNDTTKAWRKLSVAFFTDEEVLHTANPTVAARYLETLTGADRLDVLKLKNTEQLSTGGFVGGINFISDLTQFDNAVRNQYWQAQTEGDIGGVVFLVGDKLICVSNVTGTPPNLTDSTKWAVEKNLIGVATKAAVGTVKVGDGLKIDGGGKLDADLGVGLMLDGTKKIVPDVANIDVLSLKNAGLLNKGNYRGDIPTLMSGLTASLKGDWWKASTSKTLSGVSFASGDELYCTTDTPTLPATLANFAKVNANTAVMVGANGTVTGQSGSVPTPIATDNVKFLRGDATWVDVASKTKISIHASAGKYDSGETVEVFGRGIFKANTAIDGSITPVPFVEGVSSNQWTRVTTDTSVRDWVQAYSYVKGDLVVYTNNIVHIANGPIPINTAWAIGTTGATWRSMAALKMPKISRYTSNGTFTPDPLALYTEIMILSGGGGGNVNGSFSGQMVLSTGGGGGAYAKVQYTNAQMTAMGSSISVTVAPARPQASMGSGYQSAFGTVLTVTGGSAGVAGSSSAIQNQILAPGSDVAALTVQSVGTLMEYVPGSKATSAFGFFSTAGLLFGGNGGSTPFGSGGICEAARCANDGVFTLAHDATGFGGGACGSGNYGVASPGLTSKPKASGPGFCFITEYYQ